jgi:two-component system response regulator HydG
MPSMNNRILIVDDDPDAIIATSAILKLSGFKEIESETDSRKVMEKMAIKRIDAVILDLCMPHLSGSDLLPQLMENYPQVPVIMQTSSFDVKQIVECMKLGAFDYLVKPVENELLVFSLRKALERSALTEQIGTLRDRLTNDRLDHPEAFAEIVTRNRKMRSLFEYIEMVSPSSQVVLITGESGTGKELVARIIHRLSGCKGELVPIDVAGLDDKMFSDALFGHKRGAFTGAEQPREGLIVKAAGGVLFLDEIGDLAEFSQVRLLRLIQEREFYPLGSDTPCKCNARIICATNKDLSGLMAAGQFRNDLFYRLNVHRVALPPLRERKEDIPLLLDHFIGFAAHEMGIKEPSYPNELLELLATYHFPGNIRELQGMVFDAVARCKRGILSCEPFRRFIAAEKTNLHPFLPDENDVDYQSLQRKLEWVWGHFPSLREVEEQLIDIALSAAKGNQGIAATMLGLKRPALSMRLKARKGRT